ncbi:uncharacterized protein B0P05DRAFT_585570 [Gilbertella persicaria]|uniref:DUF7137 domain-containing protein n=1 Tax=Rhizopus stolonifer TaxID=4846 RepID=A0A367J2K6_RHIST|nr:uncharacterized protein B0P05DRAFT_585570 [Gilbertella persicaria]KAI8084278.1 hypothetical protein B0P05DRAFT_585570 [Gilbertella persicaria]RCH84177.1 hypothetical protein CU098_004199 [Rhizopus stolonifer]
MNLLYYLLKGFVFLSLSVMCLSQTIDKEGKPLTDFVATMSQQTNSNNFRKKSKPTGVLDKLLLPDPSKSLLSLPTNATFDHTHRPGLLLWKTPKLVWQDPNRGEKDPVILGPVYRLPVDSDDSGAQVQMEWSYTQLKVRPDKLTIEAVGPNKATWTISVIDGTLTTATWDLRSTPSYSPLIEGFYTLNVHDQRGPASPPKPGWLIANDKMKVALYKTEGNHVGEKYAPSECATCFEFVMQGFERLEGASTRKYVNSAIVLTIWFLWTLL